MPQNVAVMGRPQLPASMHMTMRRTTVVSMSLIATFIHSRCERGCSAGGMLAGGSFAAGALPLVLAVGAVPRRQRRWGSGKDSAGIPAQKQPVTSAFS